MSDKTLRELLALAAKAAGTGGDWDNFRSQFRLYIEGQTIFLGEAWAPHDDDGDSRRLQVKCEIEAGYSRLAGYAWARAVPPSGHVIKIEEYGADGCAAMRLAVLRAAAEIWRAKL